jgi:hypothetical protein
MNQLATLPTADETEVQIGNWRFAITFAALCTVQGAYYLLTGIWPLLSLDTFEAVTGPKVDDWLVRTVGCLVAVQGGVLLLAAWRKQWNLEVAVLAIGSAAMLTLIDVFYSITGVISLVYLLDAAVEVILIAGWVRFLLARRNARPSAVVVPEPVEAPR